jgi:hypothetical protein
MAGAVEGATEEATMAEMAATGEEITAAEAVATAALTVDPTEEVRGGAAEGTTMPGVGAVGVGVAATTCRLLTDGAAPLPRMPGKPYRRVGP